MINWITSYPKSGNTWVRMLLNAYFDNGHLDINVMPWGVGDNRRFPYQAVSPIPIDKLTRHDVVLLRPAALMNLIESIGQKPLIVKTHHCNGTIDDIPLIPERLTKRAFYVVRDPRDVAISWANHTNVSIDEAISDMADTHWTIGEDASFFHTLSSWSNHVNSWLSEKPYNVHLIRYERLLTAPGEVLSAILDAIGFENVSCDRIDRAVKATEFAALQEQEKNNAFEESPEGVKFFREGKSTWRDILSLEQVERIESDHYKTMENLGYGTTTL